MTPIDLTALGPDSYPGIAEQLAANVAKFRAAALHALATSRDGKDLTPEARAWAQHWAQAKTSSGSAA